MCVPQNLDTELTPTNDTELSPLANENPSPNSPVSAEVLEGKTYSLRLRETNSDRYYDLIAALADKCLQQVPDPKTLLANLQALTKSRRRLKRIASDRSGSPESRLIELLRQHLSAYTTGVQAHLRERRGFLRWGGTLSTSEEQYHLYMIEIEVTNRFNMSPFNLAETKLAFLPHCRRDLEATCKAAQRDVDYVCKGCTDGCSVNLTSKLLRRHRVKPYIWMTANLQAIFRKARKEGDRIGVLGIACVPELVRGMRLCMGRAVPVVGIPLDANRCSRWWGEFYWNGVNLRKLESLFS